MEKISSVHFSNISEAEADPFADITEWSNEDHMQLAFKNYYMFYFVSSLISKFVLLTVMCPAHVFLIFVFCRYKKIRSRLNLYILNCSILDLSQQVVRITSFVVVEIINVYSMGWFCFETLIEHIGLCLYLSFGLGLALDWFISCYKPYLMQRVDTYFKFLVIGIYVVAFIFVTVKLSTCSVTVFWALMNNFRFVVILFITVSVLLSIINVFAGKINLKNNNTKTVYALTISNVCVYSFGPVFLYYIIGRYFSSHVVMDIVIMYTAFVPEIIAHCHFLLILFVFWKRNKDFKVACSLCFKRTADNDVEENLSENYDVDNNGIENTYTHADNHYSNNDDQALVL